MKKISIGILLLLAAVSLLGNDSTQVATTGNSTVWKFYDGPVVCYVAESYFPHVGPGISCIKQ